MPDPATFPYDELIEATARVMKGEEGPAALTYGEPLGYRGLRELIESDGVDRPDAHGELLGRAVEAAHVGDRDEGAKVQQFEVDRPHARNGIAGEPRSQSVAGWAPHRVARAGVAYVPEGRLIFPDLSVVENIKVAERVPAKEWTLDRLMELFPSLKERAGNRGSNLSGGEQQMLAIARALVSDPKVLLLDEPMAGMGHDEAVRLMTLLQGLKGSIAMILVEHDMDAVFSLADRVSVLVDGEVVACAAPEHVRQDPRVRSAYLGDEDLPC